MTIRCVSPNRKRGDIFFWIMGEGGAVLPASGGQLEERISFRIAVLVSACVLTFGSYWCYDIPGAMTDSLESICPPATLAYEHVSL